MAYNQRDQYERSDRGRERMQRRDEPDRDVPDSYAEDRYMQAWFEDEDDRRREQRGRERGYGSAGQDRGRERQQPRERGERGFFDRAGEEISSWFRDEDERPEQRQQQQFRSERDRRPQDRERDSDEPMYWVASETAYVTGYPERDRSDRSMRSRRPSGTSRDELGRGSQWDRDDYRRTSYAGSRAGSNRDDDMYFVLLRNHQMEQLDRDYEDYCRENNERFENDFGQWRQQREGKRRMLGGIEEHAEVVGSDGEHVGTVDCVKGDRIVLTKSDPEAGGMHHSISCSMVDSIDDGKVKLNVDAEQAKQRWQDERSNSAMFGERDDSRGPHMLNRSFSGTYR